MINHNCLLDAQMFGLREAISFNRVLSSRCGISAVNIIRSGELRVLFFLFFSGAFYFLTLSLSKELFFKNWHFLKNKFAYIKNIVYLCITISNSATCLKQNTMRYKKVKTKADILADPRIDELIMNYDGYGRHMVACKTGWNFERERTIDIGNMKEICDCINDYLESNEENGYIG